MGITFWFYTFSIQTFAPQFSPKLSKSVHPNVQNQFMRGFLVIRPASLSIYFLKPYCPSHPGSGTLECPPPSLCLYQSPPPPKAWLPLPHPLPALPSSPAPPARASQRTLHNATAASVKLVRLHSYIDWFMGLSKLFSANQLLRNEIY